MLYNLLDMKELCAVTSLLILGTFSGAQMQSSVDRPCPGDRVTFTCTIPSPGHQWNIPSLSISRSLLRYDQGRVISDHPPFQFNVTEVMTGSITSTATVTATADLNGTLVVCRDGVGTLPDQSITMNLRGPPSIPLLSCVNFSGGVSEAVNVSMSWTLSGGDSGDFYLINITTNTPQTPYGRLLNITTASVTQHEVTGFMTGYEYNITVHGVNCGSQEGRESEPLTITPQVPAAPSSCNISLSYSQSSGRLLFINSTWNTVPNPNEPCRDVSGNITQYQIRRITGSVNIARCTAGRCSHTFEPPSNPPSSYDSVSVAAENVVGVGAAGTCTTQPISTMNNLLTGEVVDVTSPTDARTVCTFLSGFTGTAHCTVKYGTDPTYVNLPYSAESNETGRAGDTVSVVLRERLNSSTVYYYTVSAVSGDLTVVVRGTFTTPQYSCNLTELWNPSAANTTFLPDVSLLDDATQYPSCDADSVGSVVLVNTTLNTATVAYYTGTTSGSRACFVCEDGYELSTTTDRFCQRNGLWSGNPITCVCRLPPQSIALIVMGAFAIVVALFGATVTFIDGITFIWIRCNVKQLTIQERRRKMKYEDGREKTDLCWRVLVVTATVCLLIGVILWIIVGVMVSNPPNGNACDPSWRSTRDGLIGSAFAVSIVTYILAAAAVLVHVHYHKKRIKKKTRLFVLLVIALIFLVIGVGLWIASAMLVYIHLRKDETTDDDENNPPTDGNSDGQTLKMQDSRKEKEKESEKTAGPAGEETSKQSKQNKASPGLMYAELGSQVHPAAVIPPSNDDNVVRYASLIQVQSTATDPAADDTLLSPKLLESSGPQQSERDAPPPRPPKTKHKDAALPPRPPKTHQEDAVPPPCPPKTHQH